MPSWQSGTCWTTKTKNYKFRKTMADSVTEDWKKALQTFYDSVEKDLKEIRKAKAEIQRMKIEIDQRANGQYIHDDSRIVLSAPEIIIGNVDYDGMLKGDAPYSHVIIRSNNIDIEGASPTGTVGGGSITQRASVISTIAVDPGADGLENVVGENSAIIQQARSISINTNNSKDVFTQTSALPTDGVIINSDTSVTINATPSNERQTENITDAIKSLDSLKSTLKSEASTKKRQVEDLFKDIDKCFNDQEGLTDNDLVTATSLGEIFELNEKLEQFKTAMVPAVAEYASILAQLAEVNRQKKALDDNKKSLSSAKSDFKTKTNNAGVTINGETISLTSIDGDGSLRTNNEAAINMQAQSINILSKDGKGALMEKGRMRINVKTIDLSTADTKIKDNKNWENPAVGDINVVSKNIKIEGVDYETKDGKQEIKEQTKEGKLSLRIENVEMLAADKEGKANGSVAVNAKAMEFKSMDVDKEKLTDKELAAGSTMVLISEKMWEGSKDDKTKSKQVQIASEKVAVIAKTTAEIQQDKATVQLDGGKLSVGGSKSAIYGDLTVNSKSEFKGDIKAGKATIDNVEAKSSFKSSNISDGVAVSAPASSGSLSAKLKEEEAPKKQNK